MADGDPDDEIEYDEYDFGDDVFAEPHPVRRRSRGMAMAAAMTVGIGTALQEIYEGRPKQESAIVVEADDDEPLKDRPVWIDFDPLDPSATVVHVRPDA
jgi:hypothetical protein